MENKDMERHSGRRAAQTPPFPATAWKMLVFLVCLTVCTACGDDGEYGRAYPSILTEFVELYTDSSGNGTLFATDDGRTYAVNSPIQDLKPDAVYRLVLGYEVTDDSWEGHTVARVYTAETVNVLEQKEEPVDEDDPVAVASIWEEGNYLNLHLVPKTQGGKQEWGYRTDSVRPSLTGENHHLSLCHRQSGDAFSYSVTVYASLPLRPLGLREGDSIVFSVLTFDGRKTWRFGFLARP